VYISIFAFLNLLGSESISLWSFNAIHLVSSPKSLIFYECDPGDPNQDFNHEKFAAGLPGVLELSEFNFPPMAPDERVSMYNTGTKNGAEIHGEWKTSEITERTKWVLSPVPVPTTRRQLAATASLPISKSFHRSGGVHTETRRRLQALV